MNSTDFKDLFSERSSDYAKYRPTYPSELFDYLSDLCAERQVAWDVATGNGQAALSLAERFDTVVATDASEKQISLAVSLPRITYKICKAEDSGLAPKSVNLITVAQALHWIRPESFSREVSRVAKNDNSILAVWGYAVTQISPEIDKVLHEFAEEIVGPYWEPERRYVDTHYADYPIPFEEIPARRFEMTVEWSLEQTVGYLSTWSSVQKATKVLGLSPIENIRDRLHNAWGEIHFRTARWDLRPRVFRVH